MNNVFDSLNKIDYLYCSAMGASLLRAALVAITIVRTPIPIKPTPPPTKYIFPKHEYGF